ncbi:MAG: hypothetical protein CM15mP62_28940 [Rhodospirillaceae bacterium]|nr:MAG: hypothetical protein CM15mP62_28940 [Rhodospirillaceae bacterium]
MVQGGKLEEMGEDNNVSNKAKRSLTRIGTNASPIPGKIITAAATRVNTINKERTWRGRNCSKAIIDNQPLRVRMILVIKEPL